MTIKSVRDTIKTALEKISGLRAYDTVPENVECPAAFVKPLAGIYHETADAAFHRPRFEVTLLLCKQGDISEPQDALDDYLEASGTKSVMATIEAEDASLKVIGWRDYGGFAFGTEQQVYMGVKFDVEALV